MSQHGTRSLPIDGVIEVAIDVAVAVDGAFAVAIAVAIAWRGPRRFSGAEESGVACVGSGTRVGFGGGTSCGGAGSMSGGGAFNGLFNGAFAELFDLAPRAGNITSGATAANALRNDALDDHGALDGRDTIDGDAIDGLAAPDARDGSLGAARIAPRIVRTCVAHDWVASPRIAERVDIPVRAIRGTGRTGVVIERSPRSISRDAGCRTIVGRARRSTGERRKRLARPRGRIGRAAV